MVSDRRRAQLLDELVRIAQRWARGRGYDERRLAEARGALLADTHDRLVAGVPVYAALATAAGLRDLGAADDPAAVPDLLADRTLLTDAVFKSYHPDWLDGGDYPALTRWLGTIARLPAAAGAAADATNLDDWLAALGRAGVPVATSAGTAGTLALVPRDQATYRAMRMINLAVLGPLLLGRLGGDAGLGSRLERLTARAAAGALPAHTFASLADRMHPRRAAAFLLDFESGPSGGQWLGRELGAAFGEYHPLYPTRLPAEALRALARGPRSWPEIGGLRALREGLATAGLTGAAGAGTGGSTTSTLATVLPGAFGAAGPPGRPGVTGAPAWAGMAVTPGWAGLAGAAGAPGDGERDPFLRRLVGTLRATAGTGQRVFVFGTPYQLLRLVRTVAATGRPVSAPAGSVVLCCGGWQGHGGAAVPGDVLTALVREQLGVPELLEAYSMIELNTALLRCHAGRFHVPPLVAPYVLDADLRPVPGRPARGRFAFLDPLARTYPGFIASGDEVTLHGDGCPCGLAGPALTDITRLPHASGTSGTFGTGEAGRSA
jgi:hypothetical protein